VPALENMPELYFDAVPFWIAFTQLSSSRQTGFGIGAIPYSEITNWLNENNIFRFEEREEYRRFINVIDGYYVEKKAPKSNNKSKKG